jgi:hypothetical protein
VGSIAKETPMKRWLMATATGILMLAAAGCAGLRSVSSEVSSYGDWPAGRKPATYAFERLPSQKDKPEQQAVEDSARKALEAAGFAAAAEGAQPDVLVQVGVRVSRYDVSPWDDPLWWRGGFGPWPYRPWGGGIWWSYPSLPSPRYEREVAVLIRDRTEGKPLYETRARNDGGSVGGAALFEAMFLAALKDFPALGLNPRTVVVQMPGAGS